MKVKDLLTTHHRWTKKSLAKSSSGKRLVITSEFTKAARYCLIGAIYHCYPDPTVQEHIKARIRKYLNTIWITTYNDTHTFKDIRKLVTDLDI